MVGSDTSPSSLGIIPCAIAWLFRLINEQKDKTGARFSVRVSAVEVYGKEENLKDLLANVAHASEASGQTAPGVYLRDDPISGTQLENQSELRAPNADKAAFYLDAALASRTTAYSSSSSSSQHGNPEDEDRMSHILFTLHVYQYRVEKSGCGSGVAGGRSRLHVIDLGSGRASKDQSTGSPTALSLPAIASVLLALVTGQRHVPHRESKLSQLLREAMGSLSCKTCMIAHVSSNIQHYNESLQVIQLASKIHRMRRRKAKISCSGTSSDDSSSCDSFGIRRAGRPRPQMGIMRSSALTSSEADYTSSSEQSCDTAIYIGRGDMTDGEGPPTSLMMQGLMRQRGRKSSCGSESDCSVSSSQKAKTLKKNTPRTNVFAWPRAAVKNAVEALSTQKEQWVDGPRAVYKDQSQEELATENNSNSLEEPSENRNQQISVGSNTILTSLKSSKESAPVKEEHIKSSQCKDLPDNSTENLFPTEQPIQKDIQDETGFKQMIDKETQSEEPYDSESSATNSSYSTLDDNRMNKRILSDISERTEDTESEKERSFKCSEINVDESDEVNNLLDSIEPPSLLTAGEPNSNCATLGSETKTISGQKGESIRATSTLVDSSSQSKTDPAPCSLPTKKVGVSSHGSGGFGDIQVARVKPFVRDWVEKHSMMAVVSSEAESPCVGAQTKHPVSHADKEEHHKSSGSHMMPIKLSNELNQEKSREKLSKHHSGEGRRHHRSKKFAQSNPIQAPAMITVTANFSRVAEWVQSVNLENTHLSIQPEPTSSQKHSSSKSHHHSHKQKHHQFSSLDRDANGAAHSMSVADSTGQKPSHEVGHSDSKGPSNPPTSEIESETQRTWQTTRGGTSSPSHIQTQTTPQSPHSIRTSNNPQPDVVRPAALRRPDGASNPQLHNEQRHSAPDSNKDHTNSRQSSYKSSKIESSFTESYPQTLSNNSKLISSLPKGANSARNQKYIEETVLTNTSCMSPSKKHIKKQTALNSQTLALHQSMMNSSSSSPKTMTTHTKDSKKRSSSASPGSHSSQSSAVGEVLANTHAGKLKQHLSQKVSTVNAQSTKEKGKEKTKDKKEKVKEGKTKEKSRLSFLTSPLFGKRKDKDVSKKNASKEKPHRSLRHSESGVSSVAPGCCVSAGSASATSTMNATSSQQPVQPPNLASPYNTVTQPRHTAPGATLSSSGQGSSDCSSGCVQPPGTSRTCPHGRRLGGPGSLLMSTREEIMRGRGGRTQGGHASSGYESMLRDSSEVSSHCDSSTSERSSLSGMVSTNTETEVQESKKKSHSSSSSSRRSQSAPPRSEETSEDTQSPISVRRMSPRDGMDPDELKRRYQQEKEDMTRQIRFEKIYDLLAQQDILKQELLESKERILSDPASWSFDLYVTDQMDPEDAGFLEALEKETEILRKRVNACKSHILMVTSFDVKPSASSLRNYNTNKTMQNISTNSDDYLNENL